MDQILRIDFSSFIIVLMQKYSVAVMPQMVRIIRMCLTLAVITEKLIKPHICRNRGRAGIAQSPFTKNPGRITCRFHQFSQSISIFSHRLLSFRFDLFIAANLRMTGMQSRHQGTTGRGTDRTTGIMLGKQHTFLCHPVDIRSLDLLLSVTAYISVTQVISQDIDNIHRPPLRRCFFFTGRKSGQQSSAYA